MLVTDTVVATHVKKPLFQYRWHHISVALRSSSGYKDTLKPCVAGLDNKDGIKLSIGNRGTQKGVYVECSAWPAGVTANGVGLHAHHRTESCTYQIHSARQCIDLRSSTRRWCANVNTVHWHSAHLHHQTLPAHATFEGRLSDVLSCAAPSG